MIAFVCVYKTHLSILLQHKDRQRGVELSSQDSSLSRAVYYGMLDLGALDPEQGRWVDGLL